MISHLSIVYMRGASRQYGSTLNPPLLSLFPPLFSLLREIREGERKKSLVLPRALQRF